MQKRLKIAFISSEVTPFAKVGGLADVVGALPKCLRQLGLDVRIITARYKQVRLSLLHARKRRQIQVNFGKRLFPTTIWEALLPGSTVPIYLLDQPRWLAQGEIYKSPSQDLAKRFLAERFLFLSQAALQSLKALKFHPDLIHVHDWPTAIISVLLNNLYSKDKFFDDTQTLLTVHNFNHQHFAKTDSLQKIGIPTNLFPSPTQSLTSPRYFNLLALGIFYSDAVNTVSPTYAKEVIRQSGGAGLKQLLRKKRLTGILNGIDTAYFNPQTDQYIKTLYGKTTLTKKAFNKTALQKSLGLPEKPKVLLAGVVTRLSKQKGLPLITAAIKTCPQKTFQFIILGLGEKKYSDELRSLQRKYPKKLAFLAKFDPHLARQIYAASDVFLMPSLYEPCGLTQLTAMRYGTIPVVRDTGGLHDTVRDYKSQKATGFVFKPFSAAAFIATLKKAYQIFLDQNRWRKLQQNAMGQNFSWEKSARAYLGLYRKIIKQ